MKNFIGIVIRVIKYQENNAIVKVFSKEGVSSILVNNIKKKIFFFGCTNVLEIEIYDSKNDIFRLKNVNFSFIGYSSPKIQPLKLFISEILYYILSKENINETLFEFIYSEIKILDEKTDIKNFIINFLMKISFFLGFYPENDFTKDYFDLKEGIFCEKIPKHNLYIPKVYIPFWRDILEEKKLIDDINFNVYLKIILTYYRIHINNFRVPTSYELFKSIL